MTPFTFQGYGKEGPPITLGKQPKEIAPKVVAQVNPGRKLCTVTPVPEFEWEATINRTILGRSGAVKLGEFRAGVIFGIDETPIELSLKSNSDTSEEPIGKVVWEDEQKV